MEYAKLGKTDIEVSKLAVGCMSFGKAGTMHDWTLNEDQTEAVVKRALDLGINFFDTAKVTITLAIRLSPIPPRQQVAWSMSLMVTKLSPMKRSRQMPRHI